MASYLDKDGLKAVWSRVVTQVNESILNYVFPVGSIYISMKPESPASSIGGTWERISQGKFLLGADSTYAAGETGGEATHTLTVDEMPEHSHEQTVAAPTGSSDKLHGRADWNGDIVNAEIYPQGSVGYEDNFRTIVQGGNKPHNNMPPYLVVYMWKRTA